MRPAAGRCQPAASPRPVTRSAICLAAATPPACVEEGGGWAPERSQSVQGGARRGRSIITRIAVAVDVAGIGIKAFENLAREQAERLADLLDERILYERPPLDAMRKAAGPDFSDDDLYNLAMLYASFMRKPRDTAWSEDAGRAGLSAGKRPLYADVAGRVNGKADAGKVREYSALGTATLYGHPHIHSLNIFTESRPVSGENGIAHLVPYLVVDGTVHDPSDDADRQIKVQMNPSSAEMLARDTASGLEVLTAQIAEMRERFGDAAVRA